MEVCTKARSILACAGIVHTAILLLPDQGMPLLFDCRFENQKIHLSVYPYIYISIQDTTARVVAAAAGC